MELHTPRLLLRFLRESDFPAFRAIEGSPEVMRYERPVPTEEASRKRFDLILTADEDHPQVKYWFAITIPPDDTVRGWIKLSEDFADVRQWEIGWYVHPDYWGTGIASEAAETVLRYAFVDLNVHRVVAFCKAENKASERIMQKLGMQHEAHLRETVWLNESWHDEEFYAILEREFFASRGLEGMQPFRPS